MRNFQLTLSYDGTDFNGWQTQPGKRTVQQTLEEAVAALTGEERVRVNASGRTDAGVHAVGQVVNFHSATHHAPGVLLRAVNARLPSDLVIGSAVEAPPEFDVTQGEEYQEARAEIRREYDKDELTLEHERSPYPPTRYE